MFANQEAIEALVKCDSKATKKEKALLLALMGSHPLVVSVEKAAFMLGMSRKYVYQAVRTGRLKGIYGTTGQRMTGVVFESILALLENAKPQVAV